MALPSELLGRQRNSPLLELRGKERGRLEESEKGDEGGWESQRKGDEREWKSHRRVMRDGERESYIDRGHVERE